MSWETFFLIRPALIKLFNKQIISWLIKQYIVFQHFKWTYLSIMPLSALNIDLPFNHAIISIKYLLRLQMHKTTKLYQLRTQELSIACVPVWLTVSLHNCLSLWHSPSTQLFYKIVRYTYCYDSSGIDLSSLISKITNHNLKRLSTCYIQLTSIHVITNGTLKTFFQLSLLDNCKQI